MKNPNFAVFRHSNNQKWFALIMDICSATIFLRNSDRKNEKNEPAISLAGLVLFCLDKVTISLEVKPPVDALIFGVVPEDRAP